ncbi:hypothetical protein [Chitinophaga sp. MM2321]|uniref:hypothetical protein n=1 Tax=Chitinophaga sp. MM2321 TaxID=3137178 RepID=UPI0032D5A70D
MITKVEQPLVLICIFTWLGFVLSISFMEAWIKFRAPGVTLPIGLSIGRLVFNALNKVEWGFAVVVMIGAVMSNTPILSGRNIFLLIILIILIVQTCWLLPWLGQRAALYISGKPVPSSSLHLYFIGVEIIKTGCLIISGISLFKQ